jgi:hypothetical protein
MDIQYIPKQLVDYSQIFGEDPQRAFLSSYTIESYFENASGFLGDKNFLNKLGLNIDKEIVLNIAKRRFDEVVLGLNWKYFWNSTTTYNQNDSLYYVDSNIVYINLMPVLLTLSGITGTFTTNDTLLGVTSNAKAIVISFNSSDNTLIIKQTCGSFSSGETLSDITSTASATIISISSNLNIIPGTNSDAWEIMTQVRPKEGDLIYLPVTHDLFEILFADHEEVFYQLGKIYVWKITCEKYRFSHETIDTGISDIDSIATELENNNSIENDPLADNEVVEDVVEHFLNLDPNSPF